MHFRYLISTVLVIPLLPFLYFQGKRIKKSVPRLPEATMPEGRVSGHSNQVIKMLCIGESTIAGVGVKTHEEGFSGTLARALSEQLGCSIEWKVYAKSGYTAKKIADKIIPGIGEKQAHLIVIGLGGNNAFALQNPTKWKHEIKVLIQNLLQKFPETPIVFLNMPPIKDFPAFSPLIKIVIGTLVNWLGDELRAIAEKEENVYFASDPIHLRDWLVKLEGKTEHDFFSDGVHPSKLTYQTWATEMANYISVEGLIPNVNS